MKGFIVMARVSGGRTGGREAPCKQDGKVMKFETARQANDYIENRLRMIGQNPTVHGAFFEFWVEESLYEVL
jgi:hypothetical protein